MAFQKLKHDGDKKMKLRNTCQDASTQFMVILEKYKVFWVYIEPFKDNRQFCGNRKLCRNWRLGAVESVWSLSPRRNKTDLVSQSKSNDSKHRHQFCKSSLLFILRRSQILQGLRRNRGFRFCKFPVDRFSLIMIATNKPKTKI